MEQKLYRLLGVNQYRKFVIKVKKKYDQWRGKPDTDNYFLKDYSEEGIVFLKSQLIKNAKIHSVGVLVCLPAVLLVGRGDLDAVQNPLRRRDLIRAHDEQQIFRREHAVARQDA